MGHQQKYVWIKASGRKKGSDEGRKRREWRRSGEVIKV
jgi:hypothetical protein